MKSLLPLFLLISMLTIFSCASDPTGKSANDSENSSDHKKMAQTKEVSLEKIWSSDDGFITPESVIYDEKNEIYYVSNVNENPWEKDGNGFISKMDPFGKIIDLKWVEDGINGPKGMAIVGDKLYATDIDELIEVDIPTGNITGRFAVSPGSNLNDVTVGADGDLYISASGANLIYRKKGHGMLPITTKLAFSPNGVLYEDGHLNVLGFDSQKMYKFDLNDSSESTFSSDLGAADGLEEIPGAGYLASDWNGQVFYVDPSGGNKLLINTIEEKKGAADIEYVANSNTLLVPTFFDNHIDAYKVNIN